MILNHFQLCRTFSAEPVSSLEASGPFDFLDTEVLVSELATEENYGGLNVEADIISAPTSAPAPRGCLSNNQSYFSPTLHPCTDTLTSQAIPMRPPSSDGPLSCGIASDGSPQAPAELDDNEIGRRKVKVCRGARNNPLKCETFTRKICLCVDRR